MGGGGGVEGEGGAEVTDGERRGGLLSNPMLLRDAMLFVMQHPACLLARYHIHELAQQPLGTRHIRRVKLLAVNTSQMLLCVQVYFVAMVHT